MKNARSNLSATGSVEGVNFPFSIAPHKPELEAGGRSIGWGRVEMSGTSEQFDTASVAPARLDAWRRQALKYFAENDPAKKSNFSARGVVSVRPLSVTQRR